MNVKTPDIIDLASSISKNTAIYHDYLTQNSLPLPSHDVDLSQQQQSEPQSLPQEIAAALAAATEASFELHELLLGPVGRVTAAPFEVNLRARTVPLQIKLSRIDRVTNI